MTGRRRKLSKRTSDGRENRKTGEEATFCILQVPGEYPPFPSAGWQEPPHLLTGWGAQEPLEKWRNSVTSLSGWTHSVSPVTGAGLWVSKGQPRTKLPRDWKVQDQFPHVPSKLPGLEQVSGDAQGPVRTLLCSWTREGF